MGWKVEVWCPKAMLQMERGWVPGNKKRRCLRNPKPSQPGRVNGLSERGAISKGGASRRLLLDEGCSGE